MHASDQEEEIQQCRALLDEAISRVEEREFVIEEKDVNIIVLEEKLENIKKEHEQQGKN